MVLKSLQPKNEKGVTISSEIDHPDNPISREYGKFLRITECFDLETNSNPVIDPIKTAIADLEITIKGCPILSWYTDFTHNTDHFLKNDGTGKPLSQYPQITNTAINVLKVAISCGVAAASGPAAPVMFLVTLSGGQTITNILFDSITTGIKKQNNVSGEITIRYSKWYSFKRWMRKPCIIAQDMSVALLPSFGPKGGDKPSPVQYDIHIKVDTGIVIHRFFPVVVATGDIKIKDNFTLDWQ